MPSLHEILWDLTVDDLKSRLPLLDSKPEGQNKAHLIEAIKASLKADSAAQQWDHLTRLEQGAVAEACHAFDLRHHEARVEAKYGKLPPFSEPLHHGKPFSRRGRDVPTRLNLFLYRCRYPDGYEMPSDLAEALRCFVPKPSALKITPIAKPQGEEGLFIRLTEQDALAEVVALLRLAEQGNLRATEKTAMPTAAGCTKILECLSTGDFFPPEVAHLPNKKKWQQEIGLIKPVGWVRLLKNAGYLGASGSRSKLTPSGIKTLAKPPAEIICELWKKWLKTNKFDEFNRVDEIKGQKSKGHMTTIPPRRNTIQRALMECPPNEWIDLQKFGAFMRAEDFDFEVSYDPWKLYLGEREYGNFGYAGYGGWEVIQFRYLQALLFEYAAPLGLIDIAYLHPADALPGFKDQWGADDLEWLSRYDGLRAFRITNLGAYCFGMISKFKQTHALTSLQLTLFPDLTIRLLSPRIQPAEKLLLETWAEPIASDTWRLHALRSRDAIERGQNIDAFSDFLRNAHKDALPETVEGFLITTKSEATALQSLGEAFLYNCRDVQTTLMILEYKTLKKICHRYGDTQLVVPAAHLPKFQKQVRALGLGII